VIQREAVQKLMEFLSKNIICAAKHYEFCMKNVFDKLDESYDCMYKIFDETEKKELEFCVKLTEKTLQLILEKRVAS